MSDDLIKQIDPPMPVTESQREWLNSNAAVDLSCGSFKQWYLNQWIEEVTPPHECCSCTEDGYPCCAPGQCPDEV